MKEFYGKIKGTALFSHIVKDEDLAWLLQCIEGRIVPADKKDDLWEEDGFLFVKIGQNKALSRETLRLQMRFSY